MCAAAARCESKCGREEDRRCAQSMQRAQDRHARDWNVGYRYAGKGNGAVFPSRSAAPSIHED